MSKVKPQEVGYLFVQQYYTFLHMCPEKLSCFYNSKSHWSHGIECDAPVNAIGQTSIATAISNMNLGNCRVLISSVESQPSSQGGIIVQVIGEMAVRTGECHKFTQCFFLAEQPEGYYVLNDIFRFLKEEYVEHNVDAGAIHGADMLNADGNPESYYQQPQQQVYANGTHQYQPPQQAAQHYQPKTEQISAPPAPQKQPPAVKPVAAASAPASTSPVKQQQQPSPQVASPAKSAPAVSPGKQASATPTPAPSVAPIVSPTAANTSAPVKQQQQPPRQAASVPETTPQNSEQSVNTPASAPVAKPATAQSWASLAAKSTPAVAAPTTATAAPPAPKQQPAQSTPPMPKKELSGSIGNAPKTSSDAGLETSSSSEFRTVGGNRSRSDRKNEEKEKTSVYIRGLPLDCGIDEKILMNIFSTAGQVRNVDILSSRTAAFIDYTSVEAATQATSRSFEVGGVQITPEVRKKSKGSSGDGAGGRGGDRAKSTSNSSRETLNQQGGSGKGGGRRGGDRANSAQSSGNGSFRGGRQSGNGGS